MGGQAAANDGGDTINLTREWREERRENGGAKVDHGSGGISLLRAA